MANEDDKKKRKKTLVDLNNIVGKVKKELPFIINSDNEEDNEKRDNLKKYKRKGLRPVKDGKIINLGEEE